MARVDSRAPERTSISSKNRGAAAAVCAAFETSPTRSATMVPQPNGAALDSVAPLGDAKPSWPTTSVAVTGVDCAPSMSVTVRLNSYTPGRMGPMTRAVAPEGATGTITGTFTEPAGAEGGRPTADCTHDHVQVEILPTASPSTLAVPSSTATTTDDSANGASAGRCTGERAMAAVGGACRRTTAVTEP